METSRGNHPAGDKPPVADSSTSGNKLLTKNKTSAGGKAGADPSVWLIVVVYNSYADSADCLASLRGVTYTNLHVVLVDNGSTDGSGQRLREEFPEVMYVRLEANLGFAGGCNFGIRQALKAGAVYICLLNNDTLVEPGFIEPLVERASVAPTAGVIGGKIFYAEPPGRIWFAGGCIDRHRGFTTHRGQDLPDSPVFNRPGPVDYITGCLFFVRAELFRKLGLFDERLFMYAEELDFCLRARCAGYSCFYEPRSVIRHRVSRSLGRAYQPLFYYYQVRNLLEVYRSHLKVSRASRSMIKLYWHLVLYQSYIMIKSHRRGAWPFVSALWLGWLDFFKGKLGPCRHNQLAVQPDGSGQANKPS